MAVMKYEVTKRYHQKVYKQVHAHLPIALVDKFREVAAKNGDSQSQIIKKAIENYLDEKGEL